MEARGIMAVSTSLLFWIMNKFEYPLSQRRAVISLPHTYGGKVILLWLLQVATAMWPMERTESSNIFDRLAFVSTIARRSVSIFVFKPHTLDSL